MKSNDKRKEELQKMLDYYKHVNMMSPFPIIDTEHIMKLENMIIDNKVDYDSEPVVCCAHCKNLAIKVVDGNDECDLCRNAMNETETHPTIFHYLNKYQNRWTV